MKGFLVNKQDFIIDQCKQHLKILHVGCTDSPDHVKRWESGTHLHEKLVKAVETHGGTLIGIDIDSDAIGFLRQRMPDVDLRVVDAQTMNKYFQPGEFDLIIAGDIIEHLPNPGLFIQACLDVLKDSGELLITTSNAFGIIRLLKAILFHEAVHSEHTAYYSHKTLNRLLSMEGMKIIEAGYYRSEPLSYKLNMNRFVSNLLERIYCLVWHNFAEGIIVVATRKESTSHSAR